MEPIDLLNGKFKNVTINLGAKVKGEIVTEANVEFLNDIEGQVDYYKKGNDIIITAFGTKQEGNAIVVDEKKILGKITIKNVGTKKIVEEQGTTYEASVTSNFLDDNLFETIYALGDPNASKAQKLTGTYLNEHFWGGKGDDTIKAIAGNNTIDGGKGADKMYSGEGADEFEIEQGDALVNAKGKGGDIIYNSDSKDTLTWNNSENIFISKENDNLVIEDTQEAGTDKVTIDQFFASDDRISLANTNIDLANEDIHIIGNEKKANLLEGTEYNDLIFGGDKDDLISTGAGNDFVQGGKGNDIIGIDGEGTKNIYIDKNDGDDTVVVMEDEIADLNNSVINVQFNDDENAHYTYQKSFTSLLINVQHEENGTVQTESVEIVNYFDPLTGKPNEATAVGKILVNGEVFAETLEAGLAQPLIIEGIKFTDALAYAEELIENFLGVEMPGGINVPSSWKNANVYLGSAYDDEIIGSSNKDIMATFGGHNTFTTGTKGLTGIVSMGVDEPTVVDEETVHSSWDTYNVSSFEAGTAIYDHDGKYNMTVSGVDANDIHMVSASGLGIGVDLAEYFTDSKGISNIEGIDYRATYKKVLAAIEKIQEAGDISSPAAVKQINSLLNLAAGIIDKYRGLAVIAKEAEGLKDIDIIDKKGVSQIISADSQEFVQNHTLIHLITYLSGIQNKFNLNFGDDIVQILRNYGKLLINPTNEDFWVNGDTLTPETKKYYKLADKANNMYALNDTAYKEIKGDLFSVFKNSYVGTDKDNSFTISKSEYGAVIASGYGSDSFVFNGDVGSVNGNNYEIASSFNGETSDTLTFKNYSLEDDSLEIDEDVEVNGNTATLKGFDFNLNNAKSGSEATVQYDLSEDGNGINITDSTFEGLTIKDSKRTYAVSAQHSLGEIEHDWTVDNKTNHYAIFAGDDVELKSNSAYNVISKYGTGDIGEFEYTYGQGYDVVNSYDTSYDEYKATLTMTGKKQDDFTANLIINDQGLIDTDKLIIQNEDVSNLRLYFNVDNDGDANDTISIISKANLDKGKSSFRFYSDDDVPVASAKNGITFNYNDGTLLGAMGIEEVRYGEDGEYSIEVNDIIDLVKEELAGWEGWEKGYQSTDDVLANGSAKEVKEILAMYDNAYDQVMNPQPQLV